MKLYFFVYNDYLVDMINSVKMLKILLIYGILDVCIIILIINLKMYK